MWTLVFYLYELAQSLENYCYYWGFVSFSFTAPKSRWNLKVPLAIQDNKTL